MAWNIFQHKCIRFKRLKSKTQKKNIINSKIKNKKLPISFNPSKQEVNLLISDWFYYLWKLRNKSLNKNQYVIIYFL